MLKAIVSSPDAIRVNTSGLTNLTGNDVTEVFSSIDDKLTEKMTNPMTASGDLIVGGADGAPTRLQKGADTTVFTMVDGAPAWVAGGGGGAGRTPLTENIALTIGSGETYEDINAALAYLSGFYQGTGTNYTATITLKTGYVIASQTWVYGIDLDFVTISSVDAVVTINAASITAKTPTVSGKDFGDTARTFGVVCTPVFAFFGCKSPKFNILMDLGGTARVSQGITGYYVRGGAGVLHILPEKGAYNAPYAALVAEFGSFVQASLARLYLSFDYNVMIDYGARMEARYLFADGGTSNEARRGGGIRVEKASFAGIDNATIRWSNSNSVIAESGGYIAARSSNCRRDNTQDTTSDFVVSGGVIMATSANGGVNQTANTATENGIIYK
jgi:hypothetical protein